MIKRLRAWWSGRSTLSDASSAERSSTPIVGGLIYPGSGGRPFQPLATLVSAFSGAEPPDALILGDSVMERVSRSDDDKSTLGEMLATRLAGRTLPISQSAFNPAIYEPLLRVAATLPRTPRLVILPVNLRCFSPPWDLHPLFQLEQEQAAIAAYLADPLQPIRAIDDVRETPGFFDAFDATPLPQPTAGLARLADYRALVKTQPTNESESTRRARGIFFVHYGQPLSPTHRKLRHLTNCVRIARGMRAKVLLYVTPINIKSAAADGVPATVARNVETLRNVVARPLGDAEGIRFCDWSGALPPECFFHEVFATEHLNQVGRARLAERCVAALSAAGWLQQTCVAG